MQRASIFWGALMRKVSTCDATFLLEVSTFSAAVVQKVLTCIAALLPDGALTMDAR